MKRSITPVLAALLALAVGTAKEVSAQTPPAETKPAVEAVGTFEYTTVVQGQNVVGTIEIAKKDGVLGGRILSDVMPEIPIKSVAVEGKKLTINAEIPDGALTIVVEFEDANVFAGNWSLGGDGGPIKGKRKV